ncbi:unnamed protein product [Cyclocybe aegerita]|uniref:Uncharacterized protein n=1 Tax=Cyclocybe aegerita TaxID=1973307 RepID=A0A8S0VRF7_CYCAE|nr:unnamed protein product [Cyclocybe aegerita]
MSSAKVTSLAFRSGRAHAISVDGGKFASFPSRFLMPYFSSLSMEIFGVQQATQYYPVKSHDLNETVRPNPHCSIPPFFGTVSSSVTGAINGYEPTLARTSEDIRYILPLDGEQQRNGASAVDGVPLSADDGTLWVNAPVRFGPDDWDVYLTNANVSQGNGQSS